MDRAVSLLRFVTGFLFVATASTLTILLENSPHLPPPVTQRFAQALRQHRHAIAVSLAGVDCHRAPLQVYILDAQCHQLTPAQAGPILQACRELETRRQPGDQA